MRFVPLIAASTLGMLMALGGYTFIYAKGYSYVTNNPTFTERQQVTKQPGTCLNCHASVYVPFKKLGEGDIVKGFEKMNEMLYFEARKIRPSAADGRKR